MASRYLNLEMYLRRIQATAKTVTLTFGEIEAILGCSLPSSAYRHPAWWANQRDTTTRPQAKAWTDAGYAVESVQLTNQTVHFHRIACPGAPRQPIPGQQSPHSPPLAGGNRATLSSMMYTHRPGDAGRSIVLLSCSARKYSSRAAARDMYTSPLFRLQLAYAQNLRPDAIYILSAKYGLLELDMVIEPYDQTLKTMSAHEAQAWASHVLEQLRTRSDFARDHFIFLAGESYRRHLAPRLAHYEAPLAGMPIGKQLQYLKALSNE